MNNLFRPFMYGIFNLLSYILWILLGKKGIPPHVVKAKRITQIQDVFYYDTFVETGAYKGDMIEAQKNNFSVLHSIEFSHNLAKRTQQRFEHFAHIHIHEGDSAVLLFDIVRKIHTPSIFWLDAHYSGGVTEKSNSNTPIISELHAILQSSTLSHVILIDDARHFTGKNDYPTIRSLISLVKKVRPKAQIYLKDDIIHILL